LWAADLLMRTLRTGHAVRAWTRERRALGDRIGFVPTMGALHQGHVSLIRAAKRRTDVVAVSIFVNPMQFGPDEAFDRYPRSMSADLRLCRAEGVDVVYLPQARKLYASNFQTAVRVKQLTERYEGRSRPGHFEGVTTVVTKLFHLVAPDQAFFGQKDYQQAVVVKQMVRDLDFPIEVVVGPTVREPDGLALSSRNQFLSRPERQAAGVLFGALTEARRVLMSGERSAPKVRNAMIRLVSKQPFARLDYAAVADPVTLDELRVVEGGAVLLLAAWIGKTRLIDSIVVSCR
jgi:pantoate--beta-alanine ligase